MTLARRQDLKCSREGQFCGFFNAFGIKERTQEILQKGRRKQGGAWYRIVNKIMCSLEGAYFKDVIT